jgi:hypothetical protein
MAAAAVVAISCDGGLIVASRPDATPQVWERREAAWTQVHGDAGEAPDPDAEGVERASCERAPISNTPMLPAGAKRIGGSSRDRSLLWSHQTDAAEWHFVARLWTGQRYRPVIDARGPA